MVHPYAHITRGFRSDAMPLAAAICGITLPALGWLSRRPNGDAASTSTTDFTSTLTSPSSSGSSDGDGAPPSDDRDGIWALHAARGCKSRPAGSSHRLLEHVLSFWWRGRGTRSSWRRGGSWSGSAAAMGRATLCCFRRSGAASARRPSCGTTAAGHGAFLPSARPRADAGGPVFAVRPEFLDRFGEVSPCVMVPGRVAILRCRGASSWFGRCFRPSLPVAPWDDGCCAAARSSRAYCRPRCCTDGSGSTLWIEPRGDGLCSDVPPCNPPSLWRRCSTISFRSSRGSCRGPLDTTAIPRGRGPPRAEEQEG